MIKLKPTFETEVFISQAGYLAIKQPSTDGEPDALVLLSPEQSRLVSRELASLCEDDSWWLVEDEGAGDTKE